jgi:CRISPR-associated endonuclease/helicase Cas3
MSVLFWGKLDIDEDTGKIRNSLSLINHSIDVASVFRQLCNVPAIRSSLNSFAGLSLVEAQLDRLAVLALFHDMGKCNRGFQNKQFMECRQTAGHVREVLPLFSQLAPTTQQTLDTSTMAAWFDPPEALSSMLLAAVSHHGRPAFQWPELDSLEAQQAAKWWEDGTDLRPMEGVEDLAEAARNAFPAAYEERVAPLPATPELEHHFAGLVMLADWLGSHRDSFFPFHHEGERRQWGRTRASLALKAVGLDVAEAREHVNNSRWTFSEIFGFDPFPLQTWLNQSEHPPLLILESETGSGKTEAALAHFAALFSAGQIDSLYFALPTRVAARELYGRVLATMNAFFGPRCPPVLLAVPGYEKMDGEPAFILPPEKRLWADEQQLRRDRRWAAERPKRFLAAAVAVGTIDQALLSVIKTPHAHLRRVCLNRSLLVVDEVHSSDFYMRQLTRRLLNQHL